MKVKNKFPTVKNSITVVILLFFTISIQAQKTAKENKSVSTLPFPEVNKEKLFIPVISLETWGTYSMNEKKNGTEYADRQDVSFRRLRFGAKGNPYNWLSYELEMSMDRLGEDSYASTKGSYKDIDIWKAYITAKLLNKSNLLYLHAGYYWAAISREYNTCPWDVGSFDKAYSCWYLRNFMTGKGNGIESGFGFGGLKNYKDFGFSYRVGIYSPSAYTSAKHANPLFTGRLMLSFGDPEQTKYKYKYMLSGNQWRKRNGVTVGFGSSYQGKADDGTNLFFEKSYTYGADLLINYEGLRIDGEYFKMKRENGSTDFDGKEWHIRAGYSFIVNNHYIEPAFLVAKYDGNGTKSVFKYIGDDTTYDFGINWYLNKDKLKLSLHYVAQEGSTATNTGDYLGFGLQFRL